MLASWVDSKNQTQLAAQSKPYDQQYLIWDALYQSEALMGGGVTPFNISRAYDVKSRRKIQNITDTVFLQFDQLGNASLLGWSIIMSMLLRTS